MNNLLSTIDLMKSESYIDRFKAEYYQLDIRLERLERFVRDFSEGRLTFKPSCDLETLEKQLDVMRAYKAILDKRVRIENIIL